MRIKRMAVLAVTVIALLMTSACHVFIIITPSGIGSKKDAADSAASGAKDARSAEPDTEEAWASGEPATDEPATTEFAAAEPSTTAPPTTVPPNTAPATTAPPTTAPPTTAPPTTAPPTTAPPVPEPPATEARQQWDGSSFPIRYEDGGVKITIEKKWYLDTCCYIAHVQISDHARLKTGMANDSYGSSESTVSFASGYNCLLAVNGDYAEGDGKGVLRKGVIYGSASYVPDAVYSQSTGRLTAADGATLKELRAAGYTDSFGFGASALVSDGISVYLRKDGGKMTQRTLLGTTGVPGDIYIVVTEGRGSDGVSRGLQYYEAGDLLESLGCSYGIALDGGESSAMVWNGQMLNSNIRQKVTGFVYITKP